MFPCLDRPDRPGASLRKLATLEPLIAELSGLKPFEEEEARKRMAAQDFGRAQPSTDISTGLGRSSTLAAKAAGIGREKAERIDYVEAHAPELIPALEAALTD